MHDQKEPQLPGLPERFLRPTVEFILATQQPSGAIPWYKGHYLDPWNHVEAVMGLSIGGEYRAAAQGYYWLAERQLPHGGWWATYRDENGCKTYCDTNFSAYIATGVWHHYLVSEKQDFLDSMWPTVRAALDFVTELQNAAGDIPWATDAAGAADDDALLAGCSSIYRSLECGLHIAAELDENAEHWKQAQERLGRALRTRPQCFERHWGSKARFSMNWFYPVLSGALDRAEARQRLFSRWHEFAVPQLGCRCVSDEPWVTIAESCELVMALLAIGERKRAETLYSWLHRWRLPNSGAYWTGHQYRLNIIWPEEERTTWTAGAVLLAADALTSHTPAAQLFTRLRQSVRKRSRVEA